MPQRRKMDYEKELKEIATITARATRPKRKILKERSPLSKLTGEYNWNVGRVRFVIKGLRGVAHLCGIHIEDSIQTIERMCLRNLQWKYQADKEKLSGGP